MDEAHIHRRGAIRRAFHPAQCTTCHHARTPHPARKAHGGHPAWLPQGKTMASFDISALLSCKTSDEMKAAAAELASKVSSAGPVRALLPCSSHIPVRHLAGLTLRDRRIPAGRPQELGSRRETQGRAG
eukprot:scaffold3578_cov112-Isochrysis_galbana.AAC.5